MRVWCIMRWVWGWGWVASMSGVCGGEWEWMFDVEWWWVGGVRRRSTVSCTGVSCVHFPPAAAAVHARGGVCRAGVGGGGAVWARMKGHGVLDWAVLLLMHP
jgi:hypothetical protein